MSPNCKSIWLQTRRKAVFRGRLEDRIQRFRYVIMLIFLKQNTIRTQYQKHHFFQFSVDSGRNQKGSICRCDQCFYNRTDILCIPTVSGGHQSSSRLSPLWTGWHQRISLSHHHCYYFDLFCKTQK